MAAESREYPRLPSRPRLIRSADSCSRKLRALLNQRCSAGPAETSTMPYARMASRPSGEGTSTIPQLSQLVALISCSGASYGLILDSTFSRNSSSTSPAYNNEVLCAADGVFSEKAAQFDCLGIEIWGTQA